MFSLIYRLPVESVAKERNHVWKNVGFKLEGDQVLTFANWADNAYSVAHHPDDAAFILEDFASHLKRSWLLDIGGDSKQVLSLPGGPQPSLETLQACWEHVEAMNALGMITDNDGCIESCWNETKRKM